MTTTVPTYTTATITGAILPTELYIDMVHSRMNIVHILISVHHHKYNGLKYTLQQNLDTES